MLLPSGQVSPRSQQGALTLHVVQQDVLEEDDGVVAPDGTLEESLRVGHCGAGHQLHPGDGLEVGLEALAVLGAQLATDTTRTSDHNWYLHQAAGSAAKEGASVSPQAGHSQNASRSHAVSCAPGKVLQEPHI